MDEKEQKMLEFYQERMDRAHHAIQCAVGYEMHVGSRQSATEPKFLRTGINIAMVETSAIAAFLIEKGLLTKLELAKLLAESYEAEVKRYEADHPGIKFV